MEPGLETVQTVDLLFPDYDSLRQGLAKDLYDQERVVQEYFEQAAHITTLNVTRLIFNASHTELRALPDAYLMLFLLQASAVEYLKSKNYTITAAGGCGLGIYGALYAAQAFTFPDGLYMLSKWATAYATLLQEKNFKKIEVRGVPHTILEKSIVKQTDGSLFLSEKLDTDRFVLSGIRSAVEAWEEQLLVKNPQREIIELPLEGGLYADLAPETIAPFKQYLEKVEFKDAQIPCFAPDNTYDLSTAPQIKEFMGQQPCIFQDRVQLIERYADAETIMIPFADKDLLTQVKTRYPEKNIITLL